MPTRRFGVLTVGVVVTLSPWAAASSQQTPVSRRVAIEVMVRSNDEYDEVVSQDVHINTAAAVATWGEVRLPVNDHFSDFEIVEAATIKADGRRIDVPADKILVSALPAANELKTFFADVKIHTIIYPDVAAGDVVHYKTRTRMRSLLPGGFDYVLTTPASSWIDQETIVLDAPKSAALHTSAVGFDETSQEDSDRRRTQWTLRPRPYRADEPNQISALDREPHIAISSYPDWQSVGQAFFDGMSPMSEATAEIRALADQITKGSSDPKEQAQLIRDWVARNIRYFAIYVGVGGWVAHPAGEVLANRYGDCKDHAALTRALLSAKGIESDFVLINSAPTYQQPAFPWREFDHVILFLPQLNQFIDSTAAWAPFGALPDFEADKPILFADGKSARLSRTPALKAEENRISVAADVTLAEDGSAKGSSIFAAAGPVAWRLREAFAQAAAEGGERFVRDRLAHDNWRGSGSIAAPEPTDYSEPYMVRTEYNIMNKFFGEADTNPNALPFGPILVRPTAFDIYYFIRDERTQAFQCRAETDEQTIDLLLPPNRTIINVPKGVRADTPLASYESNFELKGDTLHVMRRFISRVPSESCDAATISKMTPVLAAAARDFRWRPQFSKKPD